MTEKGGGINPMWGTGQVPESEPTHYDLLRERAQEATDKQPRNRSESKRPINVNKAKRAIKEGQTVGQPVELPPSTSRVPWNENMVKPIDSSGAYRIVDPTTGSITKGNR